jgi:hypothetical protein
MVSIQRQKQSRWFQISQFPAKYWDNTTVMGQLRSTETWPEAGQQNTHRLTGWLSRYRDLARGWTTEYTSVRIPEEANAFISSWHHPDRVGEALGILRMSREWRNRGIQMSWTRGSTPKLPHTYSKRGAYTSIVAISPKPDVQKWSSNAVLKKYTKTQRGLREGGRWTASIDGAVHYLHGHSSSVGELCYLRLGPCVHLPAIKNRSHIIPLRLKRTIKPMTNDCSSTKYHNPYLRYTFQQTR